MHKTKKIDFVLNGPDVSSIYFDFLSGPFYHSLSKNNFTMRDFNSPMVIDSSFLKRSYKMVSSIKFDGMDYFYLYVRGAVLHPLGNRTRVPVTAIRAI